MVMDIRTSRHFTARPEREFGAVEIRKIREYELGVSRSLFAQTMNVSTQTVSSWENGWRRPSPMAKRLLSAIHENPKCFLQRIEPKESTHAK